ncbi:MAG: hypothetical protein WA441_11060 [Methyloceanibacter sp.]
MIDKLAKCDLRDFMFDLLNFIEEQVELAKANPADQAGAVDVASGAIPLLVSRLSEDGRLQAVFMFVFRGEQYEEPGWQVWWNEFGLSPPDEFAAKADDLIQKIDALKTSLGH